MAKKNLQKLELTWIGKGEEPKLEPRILIESPEYSYGDPNSPNMLIHGDNLLALKALEQDYAGKVKCIYIDPPFNTGAAFEHYDDGVEHSIWLDLMSRRFRILHNLLAKDGVMFVHLDDNEAAYCKVLLDDIFGRSNYINQIINATNKPFGFKSTSGGLFKQANHIFFYAKNKFEFNLNASKLFIEKGYDTQYKYVFLNPDDDRESWKWDTISNVIAKNQGYANAREAKKKIEDFELQVAMFAIENADNVFRTASVSGGAYLKRKETILKSKSIKDKIVTHPNDDMDYLFIGGERVLSYKERLKEIDGYKLPGELITDIWTDISIEGLANEGGVDFPKGKKPEKLIERCIDMTTQEGDLVLDSFLGSGTTAAVAHKMKRKYIGIELGEQAHTHCRTRLQNIVTGKDLSGISKAQNWQGGGGFKFYTLAPSLLKKDKFGNEIINPSYNADMLAAAMAKQEGFKYQPHESSYWKQGQSSEQDFIFTTTQFLTVEALDSIKDEMQPGETLLICCKSFQKECKGKFGNITIKKIPLMLLGRCEYGKEDYSLNIINMPSEDDSDNQPIEDDSSVLKINQENQKGTQPKLF
ncbi:site-specific DNA-methyltransferase [Maribacter algicola]|uniref:Site-specific DNA-methyltransferase n=1 Tax=Maribacter algicola TaxID=2498892 RepID=A0A3R8Q4T9_9FLAO|nr:site-specific DNA-methyltransferase [Maribacter algicola]RRQ49803.1 site-specific DNA-methyltransferase [Maribacter algicola]